MHDIKRTPERLQQLRAVNLSTRFAIAVRHTVMLTPGELNHVYDISMTLTLLGFVLIKQ